MAFGTIITLNLNFNGPNIEELPTVAYVDALEAPGSLLLVDMTHPLAKLPAGVPANGTRYPNLLAANAASLLGTEDNGVTVSSIYEQSAHGRVERSKKGGIHAMQSLTQTTTNHGFALRLPDALVSYFRANPNHDYYISQWGKTTKPASGSIHAVAGLTAGDANSYAFALGSTFGAGQARKEGRMVWPEVAGATYFRATGVGGFHEEFVRSDVAAVGSLFEVGNYLVPNKGTTRVGTHGAQIFYRGYIEDLTVSRRSYAAVDALDYAAYTREVLTAGGRYYGDTHSTPIN